MTNYWPANKCGYCGHVSVGDKEKYECPRCFRTGCDQCLITKNLVCMTCVEVAKIKHPDLPGVTFTPPNTINWPTE